MNIFTKIMGGATLGLLIVCGLLYWSHNRVTEANASLRAEVSIMESALVTTEEALAAAVRERDHLEQVMSQRLAAQREIQARTETELREANARLARLRKDHEDIQDFLAIPVPDSFVDSWMRGRGEGRYTDEG